MPEENARVCAVCGKPLPTRRGITRCCSRECGRAWQKEKNKRAYAALCASTRVCRICGKEFVGAGVGGYCSTACRREQMHRAAVDKYAEREMSCPWGSGTLDPCMLPREISSYLSAEMLPLL